MKKLLFLLAMLPMFVKAQFVLTPDGLRTDDGKDFIVHEVQNVSKDELYKRTKNTLMQIYNSAKEVMTENEGESISIFATSTKDVYEERNVFGQKTNWFVTVNYKYNIMFKEGRIRISAPQVVRASQYDKDKGTTEFIFGCGTNYASGPHYIFKKNGERRSYKYKDTYEDFANQLIKLIIDGVSNTEPVVEDW